MRFRPLPPVNWELVTLALVGCFVAMAMEIGNNPEEIQKTCLYFFVLTVVVMALIGFEWPILTSESDGARLFHRVLSILVLILSPVVAYFGSQSEPYQVPAYTVPADPAPQESAMLESLHEILQSAEEEPTSPDSFDSEESDETQAFPN